MSMISVQIDELRKAAEYYDDSEIASIMRYAADTIWQLRDDLQRANAENAKLREEFDKMDKWHSAELIAEMAENAKLRELARKLAWCAVVSDCGACEGACEDGDEWPAGSAICTAVDHMMCELGVEVDDG